MAEEKILKIQKDKQELEVTEKAYNVVYAELGYKKVGEETRQAAGHEDYFTYSEEELQKVRNDDLKAFLDQEEITYDSKATKDDLIKLIVGE